MQDTRQFFSMTFLRVATPWREVTWSDFLLADILTSLSKALSDTERALCHLTAGPVMQPHSTDQVRARLCLQAIFSHFQPCPCLRCVATALG